MSVCDSVIGILVNAYGDIMKTAALHEVKTRLSAAEVGFALPIFLIAIPAKRLRCENRDCSRPVPSSSFPRKRES
jgi:hypothetical protein